MFSIPYLDLFFAGFAAYVMTKHFFELLVVWSDQAPWLKRFITEDKRIGTVLIIFNVHVVLFLILFSWLLPRMLAQLEL